MGEHVYLIRISICHLFVGQHPNYVLNIKILRDDQDINAVGVTLKLWQHELVFNSTVLTLSQKCFREGLKTHQELALGPQKTDREGLLRKCSHSSLNLLNTSALKQG